MLNSTIFWSLLLIAFVHGCNCQMPCCRYLMAPSTIYVQMNPSHYGLAPAEHPSTTATPPVDHSQIFANHLQWVIMTDKPWTQGSSDIYYAVNSLPTAEQQSNQPASDPHQPTLYFMPNWWSKIQQTVGINNTSLSIQLPKPLFPSENPAFQMTHHSYPPFSPAADHIDAASQESQQPAATITVLNEQPDLLIQNAKDAQNLLLEIQRQLQRINSLPSMPEASKSNSVEAILSTSTVLPETSKETNQQLLPTVALSSNNTSENSKVVAHSSTVETRNTSSTEIAVTTSTSKQPPGPEIDVKAEDDNNDDDLAEESLNRSIPSVIEEDENVGGRRPAAKLSRKHKFDTSNVKSHNLSRGYEQSPFVLISLISILTLHF